MKLRTMIYAAMASTALSASAFAADVDALALAATAPTVPAVTAINKALTGSACTPTSCTGWYAGAGLGGIGTNLDVIGNGLNGSAFAGGMLPTLKAGYLFAQNNWLFGVELTGAYQVTTSTAVNGISGNQNGALFTEGVKLGGNITALLGNTIMPPVTIPASLANAVISLYAQAGTAQHQLAGSNFVSGEYSGAGVLFDVGAHSFIDVDYKNIQYGATSNGAANFNSENVVTISYNYKF